MYEYYLLPPLNPTNSWLFIVEATLLNTHSLEYAHDDGNDNDHTMIRSMRITDFDVCYI